MDMRGLLAEWGLAFRRVREDLAIPGSPERCIERWVVEDGEAGTWVLERIAPAQAERREAMAGLLDGLARAGLDRICPFLRTGNGRSSATREAGRWQLSPYVHGTNLPRPEYLLDPARGQALARFLADLRTCGQGLELPSGLRDFSLAGYIEGLLRDVRLHAPSVGARAEAVAARIEPFLRREPHLPRALCHGDFHPLNIVWQGMEMAAVIDWEFAGLAHELYDAANGLGCMGIEDPGALGGGAPAAMAKGLKDAGLVHSGNIALLRPAMAASRFGWLAEWLRKNDREMVALELEYMDLLAG